MRAAPLPPCTITGTSGNDVLVGGPGRDVICGRGGNDVIRGGAGDDVLRGGAGNDRIFGGAGDDVLVAGTGRDILRGGDGDDLLRGGPGANVLRGDAGDDRIYGAWGVDVLYGGSGNDRLSGGYGDDRAFGEGGDDIVYGGPDDDYLSGGTGNDRLYGGSGNDTLYTIDGVGYHDLVGGGSGKDTAYADHKDDVTGSEKVSNAKPHAVDDNVTGTEDTVLVLPVSRPGGPTANDTDADGDLLKVTAVHDPVGGTVAIVGTSVRFTPVADLCGPAAGQFDYRISDGHGGSDNGRVTIDLTCTPDAPVATDDHVTVTEDDPAQALPVMANDHDADGDAFTIGEVGSPNHGTVVITGGGTGLTYEPDPNYCGSDSFQYALDPGGSIATVTAEVTCVDDAPMAADDFPTVAANAAATLDLTANDSDVDAGPLQITSVTQPAHGTVAINGAGSVLYTPATDYCNNPPGTTPDTFTYTLNGGSIGAVDVTVTCPDAPPVAVDDSTTVFEDAAAASIDVLANDTDTDGGPKHIVSVTQPANGTVGIGSGGSGLTYHPNPNYCNSVLGLSDTFTYTLNGGSTATVGVTVTCVDDAPVAVNDSTTLDEDSGVNVLTVLTNDTDVDGGPISISSVTTATHGTASVGLGSTTVTYDPDPDFCGDDSFTYTLTPGGSTATVNVTVTCVPDAPVVTSSAGPTSYTENGVPLAVDPGVTITGGDVTSMSGAKASITGGYQAGQDALDWVDNDPTDSITEGVSTAQTVVLTGSGTKAEYAAALQAVTYANSSNNPDTSPRTVTFTVDPAPAGTVSDTIELDVVPVDDAPVAVGDAAALTEDDAATTVNVLSNDTDVDGGPVSIISTTQPAGGTVVITSAGMDLTYQPAPDFCGDDSFTYTLTPGGSTATVNVTVGCVADAPVVTDSAGPTSYTENGAPLAVDASVAVANPDGVTLNGATVSITGGYQSGQDALDWVDNDLTDSITEGASTAQTVVLTGSGTAAEYAAALRAVTYANSSNNPDTSARTVTFTVDAGAAGSPSDTIELDVIAVDDAPVSVNDSVTMNEDDAATPIDVLANDTDVDGGPKSVTSVTQPSDGSAVITGGGTGLTYQPSANYCGEETFTYTVTGGSTATVDVTVTCVNDAPVADDETFSGTSAAVGNTALVVDAPGDGAPALSAPKKSISGDILAGDSDIDGPGPLAVQAGTVATNDGGTATLQADGDFVYTPAAGTSCTDTSDFFDYTVTDQDSTNPLTDTGRVTVNLSGCVWYVSNNASGNSGTSTAPFDTLAQAETSSAAGQTIYVLDGDGTSTGYGTGIDLKANQQLVGEAAQLQVGSDVLAPAGLRPTITDNNADVVSLASGNTVTGLKIDPQGTGGGIAGGATDDTGTIADVQIVDTGTAGAEPGLELNGTTGTFTVSSLTVDSSAATGQGSGSIGIRLANAGNVHFTSGDTIVTKGAKALDVSGTTTLVGSTIDNVTVTGSATGGVSLNGTNGSVSINGMDLTTTGGTAFSLVNTQTVVIGGTVVAVHATGGPAIDVSGALDPQLSFTDVDSTNSPTTGISLNGIGNGSFGSSSGDITGAAGTSFAVSGASSGAINFGGNINDGSGTTAVSISGRTGGTVALSGPISDSGDAGGGLVISGNSGGTTNLSSGTKTFNTGASTAVSLSGNTGHVVNFSGGGLAATTTSGAGMAVSGGGTVSVSGTNNVVSTGTGNGLTIDNTTIGSGNVTFKSVTSNGAPVGVRANNTGAVGRLIVTGAGGTCTAASTAGCTGGTISASTGADDASATPNGSGIVLNNTQNPSFTRMWIHDNSNYGIRGTGIAGLTLDTSVVNGTNGTNATTPYDEGGITLDNLTGSATISNTTVSGGYKYNVRVANSTGDLDRLTMSNDTIGDNDAANGDDGVLLTSNSGAGVFKATVTASTFTGARGDLLNYDHNGTGAGDLVVTSDAFSNNHPGIATGGGGLTLDSGGSTGHTTMNVSNNSFRDAVGQAVLITKGTGVSTQSGTFSANTIGLAAVPNSGSAEGDALKLQTAGGGTMTWSVSSNVIRQYNNYGIDVLAGGSATPQGGNLNVTITANTITQPGNTSGTITVPKNGVHLNIGTVVGDTYNACADISGNTLVGSGLDGVPATGGGQDVRLRERQTTTIRLPGYGGASNDNAAVQAFVIANNSTGGTPTAVASNTVSTGGGGFVGGAPCPPPS